MFGRLPHDPAAIAAAPRHTFASAPPEMIDYGHAVFSPSMLGNDVLSDCTVSALAHDAIGIAALNDFNLEVDQDAVTRWFGLVGGTSDVASISGLRMLDVLGYQAAHGFNIGPQALVGHFGTVATDRASLASALARLGSGYWGVALRQRDLDQRGMLWDAPPGRDDGPAIELHAIRAWDYAGLSDNSVVLIATWGALQAVTWGWVASRIEEAHATVWRQLARTDGTFYAGLTADGLVAEVSDLG